jgi:hypothetical protein
MNALVKRIPLIALAMFLLPLLVSAAAASNITIQNGQVNTIGGTASLNLTLDSAPLGLSGYSINVTSADPSVAEIASVSFPSWATLNDNTTLPSGSVRMRAVDLNNQIQPGATSILLGTLTLEGLKTGSTPVLITVNELDDNSGNIIPASVQQGMFLVGSQTGSVNVTSAPSGAEISLDGTDTGNVTPTTLNNLGPGSHIVNVSLSGYTPASQTVTVTAGSTTNADFQLVAVPQTGSISVTSTPSGAEISLDGTDTGNVTPTTLNNLGPGSHIVNVSLSGYTPASQTVTVTAGSTVDASFTLVAVPQTGSISVTSTPSGAEISLDGTDTGNVTPTTLNNLALGSHIVNVSLSGYTPASQTVTVTAGSTVDASFTLVAVPQTGSISVTSTPSGAEISLDGTDTGNVTPTILNNLAPGSHIVNVTLSGYTPASQTVTVTAGSAVDASFTLVAVPQTGSISVTSTPSGAVISLDGTNTGDVTPTTLNNLAPGSHIVNVTLSGYTLASQTVTVTAGSTVDASFTLSQSEKQADLAITETVSNATAYVGDRVTWTVTVTNLGPDTAKDVVVRDADWGSKDRSGKQIMIPGAGYVRDDTWMIPTLRAGQSAGMVETDVYTVTGTKTESVKIVSSATSDPDLSNNAATASITILAKPVPAPQVTGISPSSGEAGEVIWSAVVSGNYFQRGAGVMLSEAGQNNIVPSQVLTDDKGKITLTLAIPKTAALGAYDLVVTNPDGQSATLTAAFTVTAPKSPVITHISPGQGDKGMSIPDFHISGENFRRGATVTLSMAGQHDIVVTRPVVSDSDTISGTLSIPRDSRAGSWDVEVTNPDGQTAVDTAAFTIKDAR